MEGANASSFCRNEQFLNQFRLSLSNLLDYFSAGPVYDSPSINGQGRQKSHDDLESLPQTMDGMWFRIIMAQMRNKIVPLKPTDSGVDFSVDPQTGRFPRPASPHL
jgi:hypothetical protein